jgi:hypothetical protein
MRSPMNLSCWAQAIVNPLDYMIIMFVVTFMILTMRGCNRLHLFVTARKMPECEVIVEQGGASASHASMNEMGTDGERSLARHRIGQRIQDSVEVC